MGKGARPLYSLWGDRRLSYVDARKAIYLPLYRDAVRGTAAYARLKATRDHGTVLTLFDFDGYVHDAAGMTLGDVLNCPTRKMGHAFVLKIMLMYGEDVTSEKIDATVSSAGALCQPTHTADSFSE